MFTRDHISQATISVLTLLVVASSGAAVEINDTDAGLPLETAAIDARLVDSVKYLAGDELEGRGVGTEGIDRAADYLAEQFASMGLRVDGFGGSAFQEFEMSDQAEMGPEENNSLVLSQAIEDDGSSQVLELELESDFTPMAIGKSGEVNHELVFVGYGITADDPAYDDYADVDVEGKVVVMLRREPQQGDANSGFDGKRSSKHATFRRKIANAIEHKVAGIIMVNDAHTLEAERRRQRERLELNARRLVRRHESFEQIEQPTEGQHASYLSRVGKLAERIAESAELLSQDTLDQLVRFNHAGSRALGDIPVFFATRQSIEPMIQSALGSSLSEIEAKIDEQLMPQSARLERWSVQGQADIMSKKIKIKNVVAVLEGEGPLADETIVIGAHYDHLGMGGRGTFAPWTVEIHNGADDNASGTSALLEVARQFASRPHPPRRRMVFIAFTGEESGLLGSKHYVRSPRFSLDDTIAMINMDMVGRLENNELTIYGTGSAESFDVLIDDLNQHHQFDIDKVASGYGPSDHASFYEANVPVLFLFTGLHKDYHRPSDDWQKINVDGMRRVVDLAVDIVETIDAEDQRPLYQKTGRAGRPRSRDRAYLGIMPDMASSDGVAVERVVADGPAAEAGMQDGDLIIKIGESELTDYASLGSALGEYKPNDKVNVVVDRDGRTVSLEVTLGSP